MVLGLVLVRIMVVVLMGENAFEGFINLSRRDVEAILKETMVELYRRNERFINLFNSL